jgi:heptaprenyl diphosphate synthase
MKLSDRLAVHTVRFFSRTLNQKVLFILALFCFIPFLFLKNLILIWTGTAAFCVLVLLKKGKVRILPSFFVTLGITFFALLSPYGKILFRIGSFRITQGALESGLHRSGILTGMVFLSQFAVSPKLNFPGTAGMFLATMFSFFEELTAKPLSFTKNNVITAIDNRLNEIWTRTDTADHEESE